MKKRNELLKQVCEVCKVDFFTRRKGARFCCTNHRVLWHYHNNKGSTIAVSDMQRNNIWPKIISTRKELDFEICVNEDGSYIMRNM